VNDNEKMLVRVVVLGAGLGGLTFCKHFRRSGVLVTVVDRTNHHLFQPLLTIVIVGGGPTGLELAGTFAELARTVLKRDVRRIDPTPARIILLEGGPRVLSNYPPELSESAKLQLEGLGVLVRRRFGQAADKKTRRRIGQSRPGEGESRLERAGASRNFRNRRPGTGDGQGRPARSRHMPGSHADGPSRRKDH